MVYTNARGIRESSRRNGRITLLLGSSVLVSMCSFWLASMIQFSTHSISEDSPSVTQIQSSKTEYGDELPASKPYNSETHVPTVKTPDENRNAPQKRQRPAYGRTFEQVPKEVANVSGITTCLFGGQRHDIPMIPNFLIVGVQKAGTTSLFKYLMQHPDVIPTNKFLQSRNSSLMPGTETHFFDWNIPETAQDRAQLMAEKGFNNDELLCYLRKEYANQYPSNLIAPGRLALDKTPSYFFKYAEIPGWIREVAPWINKIILVLRNPIDRAYSQHSMEYVVKKVRPQPFLDRVNLELWYMRRIGLSNATHISNAMLSNPEKQPIILPRLNLSDEEAIEKYFVRDSRVGGHLKRGMYSIPLKLWLKHFSRDQLLVMNYDDFEKKGTKHVYQQLLEFVGLPKHDLPGSRYEKVFEMKHKVPKLEIGLRKYLEKFYQPYNVELSSLLGDEWKGVWSPKDDNMIDKT